MLKYICGLVLSLTILVTCACVSPAHAASADIMITQIQAGGSGAALEEFVVIYNNSENEVDISHWCLKNKSNVSFACFEEGSAGGTIYLPARGYAIAASTAYASTLPNHDFTTIYTVTNQSSGAIVGSVDTITLYDAGGTVVDSHNWIISLAGGMTFWRNTTSVLPLSYIDTDITNDWSIIAPTFIPNDETIGQPGVYDVCPNIEGMQANMPDGYEHSPAGLCRPPLLQIIITELLPNAKGADEGREFIEVYNPNDELIDLTAYTLWLGPAFDKAISFPEKSVIEPRAYVSFTNAELAFSLLNSSSQVRLTADNEIIDETAPYQDPKDDQSWTLIEGAWQYSTTPTPGHENVIGKTEATTEPDKTSTLQPCAVNQYRSPETNRCRLIASPTSMVTPCKDNQYRSEETNRCRNIVSTNDGPAPCEEGQERNPETNRCRNIKAMPAADYAVLGAQSTSDNKWYLWLAIAGVLLLALAYAVWEWRYELRKLLDRILRFVRIRK